MAMAGMINIPSPGIPCKVCSSKTGLSTIKPVALMAPPLPDRRLASTRIMALRFRMPRPRVPRGPIPRVPKVPVPKRLPSPAKRVPSPPSKGSSSFSAVEDLVTTVLQNQEENKPEEEEGK